MIGSARSENRKIRSWSKCPPLVEVLLSKRDAAEGEEASLNTEGESKCLGSSCYTTNPQPFPISGFNIYANFISVEEEESIVDILDGRNSGKEGKGWQVCGFTSSSKQPKREQVMTFHYYNKGKLSSSPSSSLLVDDGEVEEDEEEEEKWRPLIKKLEAFVKTNMEQPSSNGNNYHPWEGRKIEVHAIESNGASPDTDRLEERRENCWLVAEISLLNHAMVSFQKMGPQVGLLKTATISFGESYSDEIKTQNSTNILFPKQSLVFRSGEFLHGWKSHVTTSYQHGHCNDKRGVFLPNELGGGRLIRDEAYRRIALKIRIYHHHHNGQHIDSNIYSLMNGEKFDMQHQQPPPFEEDTPSPNRSTLSFTSSSTSLEYSIDRESSYHETKEDEKTTPEEVATLKDLLTIVITTSPIISNPCTDMIEKVFSTFHFAGQDFATRCPKVIICDGHRILDDSDEESGTDNNNTKNNNKVTRKHSNAKQALRNGIATQEQAKNYMEFKRRLHSLCSTTNDSDNLSTSTLFHNTKVVELTERHGYGFALREAVRHHVHTPYVCVIQHDRTFLRSTPVWETVQAMRKNSTLLKYVGFTMKSNLMYHDIFMSKYGRRSYDIVKKTMIQRPMDLLLSNSIYGGNGISCQEILSNSNTSNSRGNESLLTLQKTYMSSESYQAHKEWLVCKQQEQGNDNMTDMTQLSLIPTLFWYDNIHIAETSHYRDLVFDDKSKMVAKGGFVEDKLTQVMVRQVEKLGLVEGHRMFGCYLLDDHSGFFFTGHLDGGRYMSDKARKEFLKTILHKNSTRNDGLVHGEINKEKELERNIFLDLDA